MWGIAKKEEPARMIGNITLWQIQVEHARADIGYMLHPDHWRKGIMKEAIARVVKFGFDSMKLHSVAAQVDSGNKASALLLEAAGFVREGFFKEDFYFRGKFYDTMVYSLLNKKQS
jgi:ribosomal-protein-alanine N-acetyltransferase